MPRSSDKRERLIDAASALIHDQGFARTTLADIARESSVPLGNVYYYFKTKEDLAAAVIEAHVKTLRAALDQCDQPGEPKQNLIAFLDIAKENSANIAQSGCVYGSLCQELDKARGILSSKADQTMRLLLEWSARQFEALGRTDANDLAFIYVSRLQGTNLLGHSLQDAELIERQIELLQKWVKEF
jgi:TetR/AcrR family transcriptional repressor of nem operon